MENHPFKKGAVLICLLLCLHHAHGASHAQDVDFSWRTGQIYAPLRSKTHGKTPILLVEGASIALFVEILRQGELVPDRSHPGEFGQLMQKNYPKNKESFPTYYDTVKSLAQFMNDVERMKLLERDVPTLPPGCRPELEKRRPMTFAKCRPKAKSSEDNDVRRAAIRALQCQDYLTVIRDECLTWSQWKDWSMDELYRAVAGLHEHHMSDPMPWKDEIIQEVTYLLQKASQRVKNMWGYDSAVFARGFEYGKNKGNHWGNMRHAPIWLLLHPSGHGQRFTQWRSDPRMTPFRVVMQGRTWRDWALCRDFDNSVVLLEDRLGASKSPSDPSPSIPVDLCVLQLVAAQVFAKEASGLGAITLRDALINWGNAVSIVGDDAESKVEKDVSEGAKEAAKTLGTLLQEVVGMPFPLLATVLGGAGLSGAPYPTSSKEGSKVATEILSRLACVASAAAFPAAKQDSAE